MAVSDLRGAPSASFAESGLGEGVDWLSTHADHREAEGVCVCVHVCDARVDGEVGTRLEKAATVNQM